MTALFRLFALTLLLSLALPAAANKAASKDDLDAQKEFLLLKIDNSREFAQKDIEGFKDRIGALDKRIDDQNKRIEDIGRSVNGFGILVTVLLGGLALLGYITVTKRTAEEAKSASEQWFKDNDVILADRIHKLVKQKIDEVTVNLLNDAKEIIQTRMNALNKIDDMVVGLKDAAIERIRMRINAPNEQAQPIISLDQEQALRQSNEQIRNKPEANYSFEDWNTRAFSAYYDRQYEDAALYWKNASSIPNAAATDKAQTLFNQAATLGVMQKLDEEIDTFKKLIATYSPDDTPAIREVVARAMNFLGATLVKTQKPDKAIATFEKLIAIYSPDNTPTIRKVVAKAMRNLGVSLREMQKPDKAIGTFKKLIAIYSPDNTPAIREVVARAMNSLGVTLGQAQKPNEEIATYKKLIAIYSPDDTPAIREVVASAMLNLGITLGQVQKPDEEIATYKKLIATYSPDDTPAIRELVADAMNSLGFTRLMEAKKAWEDHNRALTLLRDAQADLLTSLERRANCGVTRGNLAYVQWLLGNQQAAEENFRTALTSTQDGGEELYRGTLDDIALHTIPEDEAFRSMVERLWDEFQGGSPPQ